MIRKQLQQLQEQFYADLGKAHSIEELEKIRIKFLSRQGLLAELMQTIKDMSAEDKREFGPLLNQAKVQAEQDFNNKKQALEQAALNAAQEALKNFDVTAYKPHAVFGHLHAYTHVLEKIENIFISMGYQIVDGPELEDDRHNFEALNVPADHPARDMQDTFWLNLPGKLMRTQTSAVQIRFMEKHTPPFAISATGRCYRNEAVDASHDFVFMQTEGLFVSKDVSMANLFATLRTFLQGVFEREDLEIRVRPGYFPFVEPGVEVDMLCPFCKEGCSVCKKTRWIELGGAGLVHPNVLKACSIDPATYSGFAFGFGLTRMVMLKYGISDIRLLTSTRIDFLEQFN